ncbi:hypothetical protein PENTCL1PPCAC_23109, partial [Pristionchus entomophagus]
VSLLTRFMSGIFSDETDEDSYGSCDRCDTSSSSVSYDAGYIYRLQQASKNLASTENHFFRNKVPLLEKLDKRCVSLSMDLIAANDKVFSYRFDDQIALDNLMWTLRFAPFGHSVGHYMLELSVRSEMVENFDWHAEVRLKVTLGGKVLDPLPKLNHPVRFSSQSPSLIVFIVDFVTVKSWSSGLVQVDIYPQSLAGLNSGALFANMGDPNDVSIHVQRAGANRIFYVNRRWIESQSDYIKEYLNSQFTIGVKDVEIKEVSPRDFLLLLRAMERFEEYEMFHPEKVVRLLQMIDMFQAGPLQRTVVSVFKDTQRLSVTRKLTLADKYLTWPAVESALNQCDPFSVRRSPIFEEFTPKLKEEILRRTSHFPSALSSPINKPHFPSATSLSIKPFNQYTSSFFQSDI